MSGCKKRKLAILFLLLWTGTFLQQAVAAEDQKKPASPKPEKPPVIKPVTPPPVPPHFPDPSVAEVQKQLQEILKVHQGLELEREKELAEIQKIMEQSRIHQQLLKDLTAVQNAGAAKKPGMEEAIRKQKIQIIEDEALKNQNKIQELKKKSSKKKK